MNKIFLCCFFFFYKSVAFSSEIEKQKVMMSFNVGRLVFFQKKDMHIECKKVGPRLEIFCHEGFGLERFLSQKEKSLSEKVTSLLSASEKNIFALASGIGLAIEGQSLPEIKASMLTKLLIIDGWAFGLAVFNSSSPTDIQKKCEASLKNFKEKAICFYGLGRGLYFKEPLEQIEREVSTFKNEQKKWIFRGYGFAATFAGNEKENFFHSSELKKGSQIATLFLKYMASGSSGCLASADHPAFCVD